MELGRSLAKKAFRAQKIPSPRCGGGLGRGGQAYCEENEYTKGRILSPSPLPLSPSREGRGDEKTGLSKSWVELRIFGGSVDY
jgi:hypothetical protein